MEFTMNDAKVPDGTILVMGVRYEGQTTDRVWEYVLLKARRRWFGTGTVPQDAGWKAIERWLGNAGRQLVYVYLVTGQKAIWPPHPDSLEDRFCVSLDDVMYHLP